MSRTNVMQIWREGGGRDGRWEGWVEGGREGEKVGRMGGRRERGGLWNEERGEKEREGERQYHNNNDVLKVSASQPK